jgi:hypothetical protein
VENQLYGYSPIVERAPIAWPDGARVAFYVGLNVEHFLVDRPSTSFNPVTAGLVPDPLNHGWRDYGPRVGIWRLIEVFDRHGIRPSVLLNSRPAAAGCWRRPCTRSSRGSRGGPRTSTRRWSTS